MTRSILIFFLAIQSLLSAFAQPKKIWVMNSQTKIPIENAILKTINKQTFYSNENGYFNLPQQMISPIIIQCLGYQTDSIYFSKDSVPAIVFLTPKYMDLNDVQIVSHTNAFHTIQAIDIQLRPIINAQDILRIIPGLFIGQHAGGGKAEQIFMRGFDLDHGTDIRIAVDGMMVNMVSHAHGQGYADLHFVIPELVDKVNFDKGTYNSSKGNFATAGFADFRTRNFLDKSFVKLEAGQFNTYRTLVAINLLPKKQNRSLYIAGEYNFTQGYFQHIQDFNRKNFQLKYHQKIAANSFITLTGQSFQSKWSASGQIPMRAVINQQIGWFGAIDSTEGGSTERYNINFQWQTFLNNKTNWNNQFYYSRYAFELYSNFSFYLQDSIYGDQIKQAEKRNLLGWNSTIEKENKIANFKGNLKIGIQTRADFIHHSTLDHTFQKTILLNRLSYGNINEINSGIFAEQAVQLSGKININLGVRGDYFYNYYFDLINDKPYHTTALVFSPKIRLNYTLNHTIQLYSYFGKGFHSNDTRVAMVTQKNKLVTPGLGVDMGGIFKINKKIVLQTALWYLWLKQELVYVGDAAVVEASHSSRRFGWDLALKYELKKYWFIDMNANFSFPKFLSTPNEAAYIPLAPIFTSSGGIVYKKPKGWGGSFWYKWMGNRPANETNTVIAKGYFISDVQINYAAKKWEAGLSIQNIFNTKWKETQFDTESKLKNELNPVSEIHFTPGTPFFAKLTCLIFF